jgi:hypothetical protein
MIAFEVVLNGNRVALAGAEDLGVLTAIVTAAGVLGKASHGTKGRERGVGLHLHLGGLTARGGKKSDEHLCWQEKDNLKVGDEVLIRVVETSDADEPLSKKTDIGCGMRE